MDANWSDEDDSSSKSEDENKVILCITVKEMEAKGIPKDGCLQSKKISPFIIFQ